MCLCKSNHIYGKEIILGEQKMSCLLVKDKRYKQVKWVEIKVFLRFDGPGGYQCIFPVFSSKQNLQRVK